MEKVSYLARIYVPEDKSAAMAAVDISLEGEVVKCVVSRMSVQKDNIPNVRREVEDLQRALQRDEGIDKTKLLRALADVAGRLQTSRAQAILSEIPLGGSHHVERGEAQELLDVIRQNDAARCHAKMEAYVKGLFIRAAEQAVRNSVQKLGKLEDIELAVYPLGERKVLGCFTLQARVQVENLWKQPG